MTSKIVCNSLDDTEKFGNQLGRKLKGGEVIELVSDLGGGKTTLTRGIVQGTGSKDLATSPSFTLSKIYKADNFEIHHFDFYRLDEAGLMEHELADLLADQQAVVVVEWSDALKHVLPTTRLKIEIKKTGESAREFTCTYPEELSYLLETV